VIGSVGASPAQSPIAGGAGGGGGGGGGLSVTVPPLSGGVIPTPTKLPASSSTGGNSGVFTPGQSDSGAGGIPKRTPGQTSAMPRPSDKAVEIMNQDGIMQIPQGAAIAAIICIHSSA
jgi:hypothetical protein